MNPAPLKSWDAAFSSEAGIKKHTTFAPFS